MLVLDLRKTFKELASEYMKTVLSLVGEGHGPVMVAHDPATP